MSKVYYIREEKPVVYTYRVYAKSKAEALQKFNAHGDYEEIGLDPGTGRIKVTVEECGPANEKCAVCGQVFLAEDVRDYRCASC